MNYFQVATFSFVLSFVLVLAALKFFPKWGLLDRPHKYGLTRAPIPYYGGLAIFLAFVVSVVVFLKIDSALLAVLAAATLLVAIGFIDDKYNISPLFRIIVQVLVALIVLLRGIGIHSITNPFGAAFSLDGLNFQFQILGSLFSISVLSLLFTVFWIVLIINSMNFLDGLNGLSSGVTAIAAFFLFLLGIKQHFHLIDQSVFSVLALILCFVSLAFAIFDFYPAKILMGDSGSTFLGFMLAVLAIFSGGKVATVFLLMGVPILDAFWVIARRIYNKKLPWKGDLFHLHHRLKDTGLSERQVVLLVYALTVAFGVMALMSGTAQKLIVAGILVLLMVLLGIFLVWRKRRAF